MNEKKKIEIKFPSLSIKVVTLILAALFIIFYLLSITYEGVDEFLESMFAWLAFTTLIVALFSFFVFIFIIIINLKKKK